MTEQEKQLLLKDLCARLPYGTKVKLGKYIKIVESVSFEKEGVYVWIEGGNFPIHNAKPYLRPMSSMTEEEAKEWNQLLPHDDWHIGDPIIFDWLNAHHFDYRGLIEKGLALEAPEGMYEIVPTHA